MSACLNEYELQAMADGEAPAEHRAHVAQCATCAARLASRVRLTERAINAAGSAEMPEGARAALRARLADTPASGATTLRPVRRTPRWAWGVPLAAAAALLLFFVVVPGIDKQTTVSASEILGRSQAALAAPVSGIEVLTYDLDLNGILSDLTPAEQAGRFTVEELIDHDHEGRYRVLKLAPDGQVVGAAADDTVRGTRTRYIRANGRAFLLRFEGAAPTALSVVALKRSVLQIFIGLMQTSATQTMREIVRGGEQCYEISIPAVGVPATSLVALDGARAVVIAADARLVEFSAAGKVSGQPFTIDFALRSRELKPSGSVADSAFELVAQPGDVVLQGDASTNPLWDVLTRVLDAIPDSTNGRAATRQ